MTPLVASGVVTVTDLYPSMLEAVGAGSGITPTALLLAALMAAAVGAEGPGKAPTLEAVSSHAVPLVPLFLIAQRPHIVKVRAALRAGGAELEEAFPELAALEEVALEVAELVDQPASAAPTGQADLTAKLLAQPEGVRSRPDLVRGVTSQALHAIVNSTFGSDVETRTGLGRIADVMRALLGATSDATAAGVSVLNAAQAYVTNAITQGNGEEPLYATVFQALHTPTVEGGAAGGAPVVSVASLKAWLEGPGEPYGRAAAVAAVKDWIAGL